MADYSCPNCAKIFSVPDWLDSEIKCPSCGVKAVRKGGAGKGAPEAQKIGGPVPAMPVDVAASSATTVQSKMKSAATTGSASPLSGATTSNAAGSATAARAPFSMWRFVIGRNKYAVFGVIGAIGCMVGAIFGEAFLAWTYLPPLPLQAVCLLIDCSGSMDSKSPSRVSKLEEVKIAATGFITSQDLSGGTVAVVGFASTAHVETGTTSDASVIRAAINQLRLGDTTNMADGITLAATQLAARELHGRELTRTILLFTDGVPDSRDLTTAAAKMARADGIHLVAIGTKDADSSFLAEATGDPNLVISATAGDFKVSFTQASDVIHSLIERAPSSGSAQRNLIRTGGWTACLAAGCIASLDRGAKPLCGSESGKFSAALGGDFWRSRDRVFGRNRGATATFAVRKH